MKYIAVDESFFDKLLLKAYPATKKTPCPGCLKKDLTEDDFEPDETLGDGTPEKGETDHRKKLLAALMAFWLAGKVAITQPNVETEMQKAADDYVKEVTPQLKTNIKKQYTRGVREANGYIKGVGLAALPTPDTGRETALIKQQLNNAQDIADRVTSKVGLQVQFNNVQDFYATHESEVNLDGIFQEAINRSESMGIYGYVEAYKGGALDQYQNAITAYNIEIKIPWTTCEDNGNCDSDSPPCGECIDNVVDGPYSPDEFPESHDKCRCNVPMAEPVITGFAMSEPATVEAE